MPAADLSRKATLEGMERLGGEPSGMLERPGEEPTTSAGAFAGRNGYDEDFLNGWQIAMPRAFGPAARDMRALRRGGRSVELKYRNFSVIMSKSRRMPLATAANIDGLALRRQPRITTWRYDGRLDPGDQWGDELYYENSFDRGHMVRREDPVWGDPDESKQANIDTFHFTNSCPQLAGVNQRTWVGLEDYVLDHARADGMRVSVFTGPFFSSRDLAHASGALIPLAFWKVVAIVTDDGRPSATAYTVSQERELSELEFVYAGYKTFQISVRQVMDEAHIDFRPLLDYDGFSRHEETTGQPLREPLESLDQVRI